MTSETVRTTVKAIKCLLVIAAAGLFFARGTGSGIEVMAVSMLVLLVCGVALIVLDHLTDKPITLDDDTEAPPNDPKSN
jgi:SNF family Na+-dependent transporter